jgi:multiple sugar transport system substrate-binding protein
VPLVSVSGRLGFVARDAARPEAALRLLVWLSGVRPGNPPAAASPTTTLARHSQAHKPRAWVEKPATARAAAQYATLCQTTFARPLCVRALPIPGRDEYLQALDVAVQRAVRGQQSPQEALNTAAAAWHEITARLGVAQQRAAYLQSLGLEP